MPRKQGPPDIECGMTPAVLHPLTAETIWSPPEAPPQPDLWQPSPLRQQRVYPSYAQTPDRTETCLSVSRV